MKSILESTPDIVDVQWVRGANATSDAPDLVIEIPHGATRTADYEAVRALLSSPLPDGLVDFFHVNTDAGAPELGEAAAQLFVAAQPTRSVAILRCRIPRTFIDCNRRIDASPAEFKEGKVTPGLMPWIVTAEDRDLLRGRYEQYVAATRKAFAALTPAGAILLLHTYAPRTVNVEVDADIVTNIRRAYLPDVVPTWPLRPAIDIIATDMEGKDHAPPAVVGKLRALLAPAGIEVANGTTYPLHPSTLAFDHVQRRPGKALCIEVRRDLLADPFEPFAQMTIGADKVARIARPLADALAAWF